MKNFKYALLFSDLIFIIINLIEIFLIYYIVSTTSFLNLRKTIFEYVIFNFSTNSNITDLQSYKILYCNEDSAYFKEFNINNHIDYINDNYHIIKSQISSKFSENKMQMIKSNICFKHDFLDNLYLEYFLIFLIILNMLLKNFSKYSNERNKSFSYFYKIFFKILAVIQVIYYIIIYIKFARIKENNIFDYFKNNENELKKLYDEYDLDNYKTNEINNYKENTGYYYDTGNFENFHRNNEIEIKNQNEIENINQKEIENDIVINDEINEEISFWKILRDLLIILCEILGNL